MSGQTPKATPAPGTVWVYALDCPGDIGTGGPYIHGVGVILSLGADRKALQEKLQPEAEAAARAVGCPLRLIRMRGSEVLKVIDIPL